MATKSVFEFSDYKRYLLHIEEHSPLGGHGYRSRIAKAANCHSAYISQVLNKNADLSLEQGEAINGLLSHNEAESDLFLLLVQRSRAGSKALKARLDQQIRVQVEQQLTLKNRVDIRETLSDEYQTQYYSSWVFAAVHILVTIPEFRTFEAIQNRLQIGTSKLTEVLNFLVKTNLIREKDQQYLPGLARIFLNRESESYAQHHMNWRLKAVEELARGETMGLHYSATVSLAEADLDRVREALITGIENARKIVRESPEETLYAVALDFFEI